MRNIVSMRLYAVQIYYANYRQTNPIFASPALRSPSDCARRNDTLSDDTIVMPPELLIATPPTLSSWMVMSPALPTPPATRLEEVRSQVCSPSSPLTLMELSTSVPNVPGHSKNRGISFKEKTNQ